MLNLTIDAQLVQGIVDVAGLVGMLQHSLSFGNDISSHAILLCKRNGLLDELQRLLDATNVAKGIAKRLDSIIEGSEVSLAGSCLSCSEGIDIEIRLHTVVCLGLSHHVGVVLSSSESVAQHSSSIGDSGGIGAVYGILGSSHSVGQYSYGQTVVFVSLVDGSLQVTLHIREVNLRTQISQGERVEQEPVVIAATYLLHTDGQSTVADNHLNGVVPVATLKEAVRSTVEGIARNRVTRNEDTPLRHCV